MAKEISENSGEGPLNFPGPYSEPFMLNYYYVYYATTKFEDLDPIDQSIYKLWFEHQNSNGKGNQSA